MPSSEPLPTPESLARLQRTHRRHRLVLLVLLALTAMALFWDLGRRDLWKPDETRYALIAAEMRATGQYLVPHANGDLYAEKPPLFFWSICAASRIWRGEVDEFTARIPSALAALATMVLLWAFGKRLFDAETGMIAATVFGTSLVAIGLSHAVFLDMLFTFFIAAGACALYVAYIGWPVPLSAPPGSHDRTPREIALAASPAAGPARWMYLGFACLGFATLTKGPQAILLPVLTLVVFCACTGQFHRFLNFRQFVGLAVAVGVVLAWFLPAWQSAGDAYVRGLIGDQLERRITNPSEKVHPFWYYVGVFPALFLPWVVFLPGAIRHALSERYRIGREAVWFNIAWMIAVFAFFSAIPSKGPLYVLPMVPPAALLVGRLWRDHLFDPRSRLEGWIRWPLAALGLILALAGPAAYFFLRTRYPEEVTAAVPPLMVVGCGGVLLLVLSFFPTARHQFAAIGALQILLLVVSLRFVIPILDPTRSNREGMQTVMRQVGKDVLYSFRLPDHLVFYTGRIPLPFLQKESDLAKAMAGPDRVYAMMDETEYEQLRNRPGLPLHHVQTLRAANKQIALVSNRAP